MPRYPVRGKTVLITGATGGIGSACARALHARGANLALAGRRSDSLRDLARSLGDGRVLTLDPDVTDRSALDDAVARVVDRFGGLDVVFANAGIAPEPPATIATIDPDEFERVVEVNLFGVWRTVRAALPQIAAARGHVLVTSSVYAFVNGALNSPYAVSKAAVEAFVRALRVELAVHHATAGVLYPGWVTTAMTRDVLGEDEGLSRMRESVFPAPLARPVGADVVARRVLVGIENRAPHIVVPRRWQPVVALRGILGPLTDRVLAGRDDLGAFLRQREAATADDPGRRSGHGPDAGPGTPRVHAPRRGGETASTTGP
ncbi:short-chain dehydrogenase/reductase [Streptomyces sp. SID3343]|uniref:short-chain dehydrogenase/reductase n=1 Tax=Streptomyces sp. SID3343 TaxID=2690260 RepID=UPI001925C1DA